MNFTFFHFVLFLALVVQDLGISANAKYKTTAIEYIMNLSSN